MKRRMNMYNGDGDYGKLQSICSEQSKKVVIKYYEWSLYKNKLCVKTNDGLNIFSAEQILRKLEFEISFINFKISSSLKCEWPRSKM